ncbi:hypothetical protein [Streptomyces sp. SBT349]|uniref:hypothetical protein n=1 Tax=Streptomyces sp. SBT349 TaxID=1580539 RepID=UPI00066AC4B2|nr:hypothetical protein [Streptomyces sp. SBT349]
MNTTLIPRRRAVGPLLAAVVVLLVLLAPQAAAWLAAALLTLAGPLAVWASAQPLVITFVAGVIAGRRWARRGRGGVSA